VGALEFFTVVWLAGMAVVCRRMGLIRAVALLFNVILAGLLAFNFWEPLATALGRTWPGVDPYADALCLVILIALTFAMLKLLTERVLPRVVQFPRIVQTGGSILIAMIAGHILAGMILCVAQTLPLPRQLLGRPLDRDASPLRPDLVWLGIVHRATGQILDRLDERWFDGDGSFVHRYARYRRSDSGQSATGRNLGEFSLPLSTRPELPASEPE
jgi:hypothetical protein